MRGAVAAMEACDWLSWQRVSALFRVEALCQTNRPSTGQNDTKTVKLTSLWQIDPDGVSAMYSFCEMQLLCDQICVNTEQTYRNNVIMMMMIMKILMDEEE